MTVTVYGADYSCYVRIVRLALEEKGVPFDRVYIDLSNKPQWFKQLSPLGKVPLLKVDDDIVIFESAVICEYLEDTQPNPLHPADPLQRARHRAWMEFGSAILSDVWGFETGKDAATVAAKAAALKAKFERIEASLGEAPYFAGERFSLVDAVFGPVFRYFDVIDRIADLGLWDGLARLTVWRAALVRRESVALAVAPDYAARLGRFLRARDSELGRLAAAVQVCAAV